MQVIKPRILLRKIKVLAIKRPIVIITNISISYLPSEKAKPKGVISVIQNWCNRTRKESSSHGGLNDPKSAVNQNNALRPVKRKRQIVGP